MIKFHITFAALLSLGLAGCNQTLKGASDAQYTNLQVTSAFAEAAEPHIVFDTNLRALRV